MAFEFQHAFRYLIAGRGGLARLTTISSLVGIAFGVACLIVVQAIYSGFRNGVEEKLLSQTAHITVIAEKSVGTSKEIVTAALKRDPAVVEVSPVRFLSSVVANGERSGYGLLRVDYKTAGAPNAETGSFVGKELAKKLDVKKGSTVSVMFEGSDGEVVSKEIVVKEIIETGLYEYDSQLIQIGQKEFEILTGAESKPNSYIVSVRDPMNAAAVAKNLRKISGPSYSVVDWRSANRPLFDALRLERRIAVIVFLIMIALASLAVAATLALLVNERRTDVAVFRTCGAKSSSLIKMFFVEGSVLGFAGIVLGLIFGYLACFMANYFGLIELPGEVYSISEITLAPGLLSTLLISAGAGVLIVPAVLIPAVGLTRIKPSELLRTG